jgi:hypothetical protein
VKKIVQAYEPLIELASSQAESGDDENEDDVDEDLPDDEDTDEDVDPPPDEEILSDYEIQVKRRLYEVLKWVVEA